MLIHANNFETYALGADGWDTVKSQEGWEDDGAGPGAVAIVDGGWNSRRAIFVAAARYARVVTITSTHMQSSTRTLCFQAAFRLVALGDATLFRLNGITMTLATSVDGTLTLASASGTAVSTAGVVRADTWHYLELRAEVSTQADNRVQVLVDGRRVIDASNQTTGVGVDASPMLHGGTAGCRWSEVIVMDGAGVVANDLLGTSARIANLLPIATVSAVGWTPQIDGAADLNGPDAHTYIDDPLPGPSDGAGTTIESNDFGMQALFRFDPPQHARFISAMAFVESATGTRIPQAAMQSGDVERESDVDSAAIIRSRLRMDVDPDGGRPWTREALSLLQAGFYSSAGFAENI